MPFLLALQLQISTPVYTAQPQDTVTQDEPDYLNKPLIVDTVITPPDPPSISDHFVPGNCTWYVASKVSVPWFGNAGEWLNQAKSFDYHTGNKPEAGSILVENVGTLGHVGLVESVDVADDTFTISEMNYEGLGVVSRRTLPFDYNRIKGFIYF